MHALTGCAVAVFGCERLLAVQLVVHCAAVAFAFPLDVEVRRFVETVWRAKLPLVFFSVSGRSGLGLVRLVAVALLVWWAFFGVSHFDDLGDVQRVVRGYGYASGGR